MWEYGGDALHSLPPLQHRHITTLLHYSIVTSQRLHLLVQRCHSHRQTRSYNFLSHDGSQLQLIITHHLSHIIILTASLNIYHSFTILHCTHYHHHPFVNIQTAFFTYSGGPVVAVCCGPESNGAASTPRAGDCFIITHHSSSLINLGSTWGQPGVNLGSNWGQPVPPTPCSTYIIPPELPEEGRSEGEGAVSSPIPIT